MTLSRLATPEDLWRHYPESRYKGDRDATLTAWRLEYKSRRYHDLWRTKRSKHGHKDSWDDCDTLACSEDRQFLEYIAR